MLGQYSYLPRNLLPLKHYIPLPTLRARLHCATIRASSWRKKSTKGWNEFWEGRRQTQSFFSYTIFDTEVQNTTISCRSVSLPTVLWCLEYPVTFFSRYSIGFAPQKMSVLFQAIGAVSAEDRILYRLVKARVNEALFRRHLPTCSRSPQIH